MPGLDDYLPANTTAIRYNLLKPDKGADSSEGPVTRTPGAALKTSDNLEQRLGSPTQTLLLGHTLTCTAPTAHIALSVLSHWPAG